MIGGGEEGEGGREVGGVMEEEGMGRGRQEGVRGVMGRGWGEVSVE